MCNELTSVGEYHLLVYTHSESTGLIDNFIIGAGV